MGKRSNFPRRKQARKNRGTGKGIRFIEEAQGAQTDDCIVWPFTRMDNGYGQVGLHSGMALAHRYSCTVAHGEPPFDGAQAAHSCANRACINPRHLSWKSQSENEADKRAHGTWLTRMGGAKLTADKVKEIRAMAASGQTYRAISATFNTPISTIKKVVNRHTWKHV